MIKTITKISFTALLLLSFTACNDTKKEKNEFKASLPIPEWDEKVASTVDGYIGNWHDAKKDPISATKIGYAYSEELKDYEKALEWYKYSDSMKSLPDNSNYACYALQQLKKYDEAISWCQKAIELGSDKALFQLATTYYEKNDFENSLLWFKKAYEKGNKNTLNNIGLIYTKLKNYNESEKWYKKAITNNNYDAYTNISNLYYDYLKDNVKASAYAIALIDTKYSKNSVLNVLKNEMNISDDIIKKGYELQLNSPDFPIKYKGEL